MINNKFTPEQIEKAKECKSVRELIALAKENGIELTEAEATNILAKFNPTFGELSDGELETVAGGCDNADEDEDVKCPKCGSSSWKKYLPNHRQVGGVRVHDASYSEKECESCGHRWE